MYCPSRVEVTKFWIVRAVGSKLDARTVSENVKDILSVVRSSANATISGLVVSGVYWSTGTADVSEIGIMELLFISIISNSVNVRYVFSDEVARFKILFTLLESSDERSITITVVLVLRKLLLRRVYRKLAVVSSCRVT